MNIVNRIKKFLHRKFDGYSCEEYMVMFVVTTIFLPFYFSIIAVLGVLIYVVLKGRMSEIMKQNKRAMVPIIFCGITILVSLYHGNQLGAICSLGILAIFLFFMFYRSIITERLFELIVDACCIVSLFCFGWALMEYYSIIQSLDYEAFDLVIEDDPYYRVNSTFFNANYYAMMVEFLILMCVYKMMKAKTMRRVVFYVLTIVCNLTGLYLSGCRTAWATFIITIPLMFFLNRKKVFFCTSLGSIGVAGATMLINPDLFPRSDSFALYLQTRIDIWQVAFRGIQTNPLLGQGPLTYMNIYHSYAGPATQHAHSVYLDPFLSFGIVGVALLGIFFWDTAKEIWHLYSQRLNMRLFSLILAFILTVLIHGTLDYTIFWVQTAQIFFIVIGASSIYTNGNHKGV